MNCHGIRINLPAELVIYERWHADPLLLPPLDEVLQHIPGVRVYWGAMTKPAVAYLAMGPSTLLWISCHGSLGPTSAGVALAFEFLRKTKMSSLGFPHAHVYQSHYCINILPLALSVTNGLVPVWPPGKVTAPLPPT